MGMAPGYDLSALGWLMFEQLCAGWLEIAAGVEPGRWVGSADHHRYVVVEEGLPAAGGERVAPTLVATAWSSAGCGQIDVALAGAWNAARTARQGKWVVRSVLVLTNLPAERLYECMRTWPTGLDFLRPLPSVRVLGASELGDEIDAHPELRLRHPFVLGVRAGGPAIPAEAASESTLDVDAAAELARVFVPHRPYALALSVLGAHNFCVLTGPPEMGKTAAARMVGLALLSAGWEVHECTSPDQVIARLRPERSQLFVADDAFGSTEYRPDAAERWARALPEILHATDERHRLIWTSRPTPLKAGLRTLQRERGSERFPAPAQVHVDAADLDPTEKALILFRHAKGAKLGARALAIVRRRGVGIVGHPHFTPERIRRFVATRLAELAATDARSHEIAEAIGHEIELPTAAMANSYVALSASQRAVLVAMLDCPAGSVPERELAAAARRHAPAGLERAPFDLVDRLSDHFLRMTSSTSVAWVHPSWRDLVIAQLAGAPAERRSFLSRCGHHGAMLALSTGGGPTGERALPLLLDDADWDALGDRLPELIHAADERELTELLAALRSALERTEDARVGAELRSLASLATQVARRTRPAHEPVGVRLLEEWLRLAAALPDHPKPPWLEATWIELLPEAAPDPGSPSELARYEDWLLLAELAFKLAPDELEALGFPGEQTQIARELAIAARPLLARAPQAPTAAMLSRLLVRASSLLDTGANAYELAWSVARKEESEELREVTETQTRLETARVIDQLLVERVLADL